MPPRPVRRLPSPDAVAAECAVFSGACYLILGHGSRGGYKDVDAALREADEVGAVLSRAHGAGSWMVIYGGDRPSRDMGSVGDLVQHLHSSFGIRVVAVQSSHIERKSGVPNWCDAVHYYRAQRGEDKKYVFGGVAGGERKHPVGATAVYLSDKVRPHLGGVIAFGGGPTALAEFRYAISCGLAAKYVPCRVRKPYIAGLFDDAATAGTGADPAELEADAEFGAMHHWAKNLRAVANHVAGPPSHSEEAAAPTHALGGAGGTTGSSVAFDDDASGSIDPRDKGMALTMHQPWASLLVLGIKRVEGRTWSTDHRGPLWIHAAAKVPEREEIERVEAWYRQVYAIGGFEGELRFPEHYPTSTLLGRVDVVGCVPQARWATVDIDESLRLESESDFVWLCESPQRLLVPQAMSGQHKLWTLDKRTYQGAAEALRKVRAPLPPKFPRSLKV